MTQRSEIEFIDCNCSYGAVPSPPFRYARNPAELLREMDSCGISKAMVYHAGMRFDSPITWNDTLLEQITNEDRLIPSWAILPAQTGEMAQPKELIASMKSAGVRVLRAFPQEHSYCLDGLTFGPLFEALIEYQIPLFVKENILKLKTVLEQFPALTVVLMSQGPHSIERYLRPLMDTCQNLYIDTSFYIIDGCIEEFCKRYSPKRLLFGSAYPDNCRGGALLHVLHADISQDAKRAIAGDNLERLIREVRL